MANLTWRIKMVKMEMEGRVFAVALLLDISGFEVGVLGETMSLWLDWFIFP